MNFNDRLLKLIDDDFPIFRSSEFLKDHAEAIRDLVVAAEAAYETDGDTRLGEALAKLEEA